jgi:hypothetical protein
MNSTLIRSLLCVAVAGFLLYSYLHHQNEVTRKRLAIPMLLTEIKNLKEINTSLQYEIDLFESPEHLMELASHSEYSHLKQPLLKEILALQAGDPVQPQADEVIGAKSGSRSRLTLALGAKQ